MALPQAFIWGPGGAQMTPERIASERKVAEALMARGTDTSPVQHWSQGLNRVALALMGGFDSYRADEAEKANRAEDKAMLQGLLGGGTPGIAPANPSPALPGGMPPIAPMSSGATVPAGTTQTADTPDFGKAIASIESGGRYDLLGPVTRTGDRAHGKYQVMGANVGPWTREVLGREMSPQEFLRDPDAQEAVFKGKFGQYAQKYGPEGAAKAWFAGEGGMNDPNRRDILGTTVAAYANKFNRALGPQTAALAPVAPDTAPAPQPPAAAGPQIAQVAPGMTAAPAIAPAPAPAASGGLQGVSPGIIGAIASPYTSEGTKAIAKLLLQQRLKQSQPETTDEIKEYNLSAAQDKAAGRPVKSFTDWKTDLKRAGAIQNTVTIDQKSESEQDKTVNRLFGEQQVEIIKAAQAARGKIATLDRMNQLLADPNIYTGAGANLVTDAKRLAKAAGFDVGDVSGPEAIRAIGNQFALELRNPAGGAGMPGAMSDKDREFLQASVPGLQQSPEGNAKIIDYMKRVATRSIEVERLRQAYVKQHKRIDNGFYEMLADHADKNPLFPEAAQALAAPANAAPAAGAAPKGTTKTGIPWSVE